MLKQLFAPQLVILYVLAASTIYIHFRGKHRLRFARQLGDHSTYLSPYNVLMYAGSAVPNRPVIPVDQFPEPSSRSARIGRPFAMRPFACSTKASFAQRRRTTIGVSTRSSRAAGSGFT
ncbi:hypothetical protein ACVWW2_006096 [Bradyrhizobium sp. LM4.3]